jgi:hypothetical protein
MEHSDVVQSSTTTFQGTSIPSMLEVIGHRRSSVLEYLIEPEVAEDDYAAQAPPDEELPEYDSLSLPAYAERHLQIPVVSYCIYQITRKVQIITPAAQRNVDRPRYRITGRGSPSLFSKKADFTLTRIPAGRAAALGACPDKNVATMNFDRNGELPWMPRATVYTIGDGIPKPFPMHARNFQDWKIVFNTQVFLWCLADKPTSLILVEQSSDSIVARFTYSEVGTDATRGAEVGQLDIYGGSRSEEQDTIELVLASCQIAMHHLKSMGRHYKNGVTPRNCSVSVSAVGNSFFATPGRRASSLT